MAIQLGYPDQYRHSHMVILPHLGHHDLIRTCWHLLGQPDLIYGQFSISHFCSHKSILGPFCSPLYIPSTLFCQVVYGLS